jgi:hydrogenase-4 membrane subunit HyfE
MEVFYSYTIKQNYLYIKYVKLEKKRFRELKLFFFHSTIGLINMLIISMIVFMVNQLKIHLNSEQTLK